MARLDDALATIEAEREARLQLEARTARLEADLCARDASPPAPRPPLGLRVSGVGPPPRRRNSRLKLG